jgi:hypothetical protein
MLNFAVIYSLKCHNLLSAADLSTLVSEGIIEVAAAR